MKSEECRVVEVLEFLSSSSRSDAVLKWTADGLFCGASVCFYFIHFPHNCIHIHSNVDDGGNQTEAPQGQRIFILPA